ncbi:MAG: AMMECR1 domain-containing protein [Spirochaetes bacterium]|nr:MAG: AMMECR1 domain-containing protein [Spirochaetota bacterium]
MNRAPVLCALLACATLAMVPLDPGMRPAGDTLAEWARFSRTARARALVEWAHCVMRGELAGPRCEAVIPGGTPPLYGSAGVFVTLVRAGKVRGCFGAFHHASESLEAILRDYISGALRRDPRYAPLEPGELDGASVIITVAGMEFPVDDLAAVDLARSGLVFSMDGGERLLFVPSEIKSIDYLKKLVRMQSVVQITAFRAVSIR